MVNWLKKNKVTIFLFALLVFGFYIRTYLANKSITGDIRSYMEWGERLLETGPKGFYFSEEWYYSVPNYPPLAQWMFSGLAWLNDRRYVLAQLHNLIKIPPATFIIYFYKWGDVLLTKLPSILCDLGIAVVVYKLILKLTKSTKKSIIGFCIFLFNPVSIFLSGVWGQTDSIVGILGILAFLALINKNIILSMSLLFLSIYFKPSWAVLGPFYLFLIYKMKPKMWQFLVGVGVVVALYIVTTLPFSDGNVFAYGLRLYQERYPIPIGFDGKASISAFNFQTIFWRPDIDFSSQKLLGITSGNYGIFFFLILNLIAMFNFAKQKDKLTGMLTGIFTVGMGYFLFMPTMLERYFFPAFPAMIILALTKPKLILNMVIMNLILFANLIYSYYRRESDEIYHFFIDNNYLLIRVISIAQVILFATFIRPLVVQFKRERDN